jgi:hypothetical protein
MKTTGGALDYWNMTEEQRQKKFKDKTILGTMASVEFREATPRAGKPSWDMFLLIAMKKPKRSFLTVSASANVYAIIQSKEQLVSLYRKLPPGDRHIAEVVLPTTPNRFFMDIEKDIGLNCGFHDSELESEMNFMKTTLRRSFLPYLCMFFRDKLGVHVDLSDCVLMDGSKMDEKFSVHLTVKTAQNHYFIDQLDTFTVATLFTKYCQQKAVVDEDFRKWYFYKDGNGTEKTTVDHCVNDASSRNMRMIGCCKANNLPLGQHWTKSRVFCPAEGEDRADFSDFFASVYEAPSNPSRYKQIVISDSIYKEAADYSAEMCANNPPKWFYGKRLGGKLRAAKRGNLSPPRLPPCPIAPLSSASSRGLLHTVRSSDDVIVQMGQQIRNLGTDASEGSRTETELENGLRFGETVMRNEFDKVAMKLLNRLLDIVHPGNTRSISQSDQYGEVWSAQSGAFHQGIRRCFLSGRCGGQHNVVLRCFADLSVDYFCHGCRKTKQIIPSPVRVGGIKPKTATGLCPPDFDAAHGMIDYDLVPPDYGAGDDDVHMRAFHLGDNNSLENNTIVLHGGMGSGKTKTTKDFIHEVRDNYPGCTILAFSFRKMLAVMFAKAFNLQLYSECEQRSLFGVKGVAIQIDSLERLGEEETTELNGNLNVRYKRDYDVVVVDELESVLAHFDSSTLKNKLNAVWAIFYEQIRGCKTLVVCDADIGPRSYRFLRETRSTNGIIPGLQYHVNRHVAIATRFFDYMGEFEWMSHLVECLMQDKNVFFFSNERAYMGKIVSYVESIVRGKMVKRARKLGEQRVQGDALLDKWALL